MHELSIAQEIVRIVAREGANANAVRVSGASVSVGRLMAVETDNLLFCLDVLKKGDPLTEHTVFSVEEEELQLRCKACSHVTVTDAFLFACGACHSPGVDVIGGEQLEVSYLEVECDGEDRREAKCDGSEQ